MHEKWSEAKDDVNSVPQVKYFYGRCKQHSISLAKRYLCIVATAADKGCGATGTAQRASQERCELAFEVRHL